MSRMKDVTTEYTDPTTGEILLKTLQKVTTSTKDEPFFQTYTNYVG